MGCNFSTIGKIAPEFDEPVNKKHFEIERVIGQGGFGRVNAVVKCKGMYRYCVLCYVCFYICILCWYIYIQFATTSGIWS